MFLKYLEPLFKPWRVMRTKVMKVKTTKGNIKSEVSRVNRFGNYAKQQKNKAQNFVGKAQGEAQKAQGQAGQVKGQMPQQAPLPASKGPMMPRGGMPPMQGMPQGAPMSGQQQQFVGLNPNPPIKIKGFFRRRKICTQCHTQLDKSWDSCPYCAQAAAAAAPPSAPAKTQAFMLNPGGASSMQLLGWLVPLKGPQRGELFTLAPHSSIGTDPTCTIVLQDNYMSSHHAEIVAQNGVWVLRDLGSTNGTKVNDKQVSQHELVDNDFIAFGQSVVKFKSL